MSEKTLTLGDIVSNAFAKGMANLVPLVVNVVLWALTVWIPYLNVGTTIGLFVGVITKISKDEPLSMTEIFNPDYRKKMGNFFLVSALASMGISIGFMFFVIPGMVISIAWSLATLLVIDKNMGAIEAIKTSNDLTYGKKWIIFGATFAIGLIVVVAGAILGWIGTLIPAISFIGVYVVGFSAYICAQAYIYQTLAGEL